MTYALLFQWKRQPDIRENRPFIIAGKDALTDLVGDRDRKSVV
jgi:hypothetical protein